VRINRTAATTKRQQRQCRRKTAIPAVQIENARSYGERNSPHQRRDRHQDGGAKTDQAVARHDVHDSKVHASHDSANELRITPALTSRLLLRRSWRCVDLAVVHITGAQRPDRSWHRRPDVDRAADAGELPSTYDLAFFDLNRQEIAVLATALACFLFGGGAVLLMRTRLRAARSEELLRSDVQDCKSSRRLRALLFANRRFLISCSATIARDQRRTRC